MSSHYVIEINIKEVSRPIPTIGRGNAITPEGERQVEDLTRVIVRASTRELAIQKAERMLRADADLEADQ